MSQDISTERLDELVAHAYEAASNGVLLALPDADRMARHELHAALLELKRWREEDRWIKCSDKHAPLYTDVLVMDQGGVIGIGSYMAHGTYTHPRYTVLGQAKVTHWRPLPQLPKES